MLRSVFEYHYAPISDNYQSHSTSALANSRRLGPFQVLVHSLVRQNFSALSSILVLSVSIRMWVNSGFLFLIRFSLTVTSCIVKVLGSIFVCSGLLHLRLLLSPSISSNLYKGIICANKYSRII